MICLWGFPARASAKATEPTPRMKNLRFFHENEYNFTLSGFPVIFNARKGPSAVDE